MALEPINIIIKNKINSGVATSLKQIAEQALRSDVLIKNLQASIAGINPQKINQLAAAQVKASNAAATLAVNESKVAIATDKVAISQNKVTISGNQVAISENKASDAMANSEIKALKLVGAEEMLGAQRERRTRTNRIVMSSEELAAEATLKRARASDVVTKALDRVRVASLNVQQAVRGSKEGSLAHKHALDLQKLSTDALNASEVRARRIHNETAAAVDNYAAETMQATAAVRGLSAANNNASITNNLHNTTMLRSGVNMGLSAHHAQNLAFQIQDIGVSLGSGQAPWRVFMQQGAQIQGIMGQARIGVAGLTAAIWTMTAPFLPFIAAIAAAGAGLAMFAGSMGEIDEQAVTMTETLGAMGSVLLEDLTPAWDFVAGGVSEFGAVVASVLPTVVGGLDVLVNSISVLGQSTGIIFANLGPMIAEGMFNVVNGTIKAIQGMINAVIGGINGLSTAMNEFFAPMRGLMADAGIEVGEFSRLTEVSLDTVENAYAGATEGTGELLAAMTETTMAGALFSDGLVAINTHLSEYHGRVAASVVINRKAAEVEEALEEAIERRRDLIVSIRSPIVDHMNMMSDLGTLLKAGRITQEEYNAALHDMPLREAFRELDTSLLTDFGQELAAVTTQFDERARLLDRLRDTDVISQIEHNERMKQIQADADRQRIDIQAANIGVESGLFKMRRDVYQQGFGDIMTIMSGAVGEQSGVYRALFAVQKAFAIAESVIAIQQAVSKAMALGFPQNIPFIAAAVSQGASIVSTIQGTSPQFAAGGFVSGPGGPTDDSINAWLSNGEFVINARATKEHMPIIQAINDNQPASVIAEKFGSKKLAHGGPVSNAPVARSSARAFAGNVSNSSSSQAVSNEFNITIHGTEGMDAKELAKLVTEQLDQKMANVYGPAILQRARTDANTDMDNKFSRATI